MVNLGTLGSLLVELKAEGFEKAESQMEGMQKSTKKAGDEAKRSVPPLEKMGKRWASVLSLVAASGAVVFGLIAKSSPSVMASLKGIQLAFESIFMLIGEELSPVFEWFENLMWKVYDVFEAMSPSTKTFISALVGVTAAVASAAGALLGASYIVPLLQGAVVAAAAAVGVSVGGLLLIVGAAIAAIAVLYTAWKNNWFGIRDTTARALEWIKSRFASFMAIINDKNKTGWEKIVGVVKWAWDTIGDIGQAQIDFILGYVKFNINSMIGLFKTLANVAKNTLGKIKNAFSSPGGGGTDRTQYDSSGRVSLHQSVVSARAMGGPVTSGASYLVGENGPEMFTPKSTGNITSAGQTKTAMNNPTKAPDLNQKIVVQLDGRTIWESIRKYQTTELRRGGVY